MNNSINRKDAIDALCDNCDHVQAVCAHYPCKQYIALEKLPSVQPEQKRGKWVKYKNWYACSECGKEMFFAGTYDESQHYCYNCGARMDMERE